MREHVHSKAECFGVALFRFTDSDGKPHKWAIGASTCPDNRDSTETLEAHFQRHLPDCVLQRVEVMTSAQWEASEEWPQ